MNAARTEIEGEGYCPLVDDIQGCVNGAQTYLVTDASSATHYMFEGVLTELTPDQQFDKARRNAVGVWSNASMSWEDVRTLDEHKATRWAAIKIIRDAEIDAPLVTDVGVFDHDPKSREAIASMAQGASITRLGVAATLADNAWVRLSPQDIVGVLKVSHARVQGIREYANAVRDEISAARNAAAVEAITWERPAA